MKATQQNINEFLVGWANAAQSLEDNLLGFKATIIGDLKEKDFQFNHSFEDFGKQAFLYLLKQFYDQNEAVESAVRKTKDILNTGGEAGENEK